MFFMFFTSLGLSILLIFINSLISKKKTFDRESPSPFECGFDLKTFSRLPFSIRFFLIAIIFLIFDVEITLLIPLPMIIMNSSSLLILAITIFFIIILILGLYHEWNEGSLHWK